MRVWCVSVGNVRAAWYFSEKNKSNDIRKNSIFCKSI